MIAPLLSGCVIVSSGAAPDDPAPERPPRLQVGVQARAGPSWVADDEVGAPDNPAAGVGFSGFVAYRLGARWLAGVAIDARVSAHETDPEIAAQTSYLCGTWALLVRAELPRITATAWGGWYFGLRSLAMDNAFDSGTANDLGGPAAGVAALYRLELSRVTAVEVGPYLEAGWLETTSESAFVDSGRPVRPLSFGAALQISHGLWD